MNDIHRYDDIIDLPHHRSATRTPMTPMERAAQFSPFAALTGHSDAIAETARLTDEKAEISEDAARDLDEALWVLRTRLDERPVVRVTYFVPDARKAGGAYRTATGVLRRIDETARILHFTGGWQVAIDDILRLETEVPED